MVEDGRPAWRCPAAGLAVTALLAFLSPGCMWVLSPCESVLPTRVGGPGVLVALTAHVGRRPPEGQRPALFDNESHVWVEADGTVTFYNGVYPWCSSMPPRDLARLRELLALLPPTRRATSGFHEALREGFRGEVVYLSVPGPGEQADAGRGAPSTLAVHWRSDREPPTGFASLSEIACLIERSLGSGYRRAIERHYPGYLAARGREGVCRNESEKAGSAGRSR